MAVDWVWERAFREPGGLADGIMWLAAGFWFWAATLYAHIALDYTSTVLAMWGLVFVMWAVAESLPKQRRVIAGVFRVVFPLIIVTLFMWRFPA